MNRCLVVRERTLENEIVATHLKCPTGKADVRFSPTRCAIYNIWVIPRRLGVGRDAIHDIEERLREVSCREARAKEVIFESEAFWYDLGYRPQSGSTWVKAL